MVQGGRGREASTLALPLPLALATGLTCTNTVPRPWGRHLTGGVSETAFRSGAPDVLARLGADDPRVEEFVKVGVGHRGERRVCGHRWREGRALEHVA